MVSLTCVDMNTKDVFQLDMTKEDTMADVRMLIAMNNGTIGGWLMCTIPNVSASRKCLNCLLYDYVKRSFKACQCKTHLLFKS